MNYGHPVMGCLFLLVFNTFYKFNFGIAVTPLLVCSLLAENLAHFR